MQNATATSNHQHSRALVAVLGWYAILGCAIFGASILVADFIVPDHDWISDTISDLGAGRYEFIVDVGLYSFSAALISIALLGAHVHFGGTRWSIGTVGFALLALIVFLVGARNEYGDRDSEGVVIHIYLVYALGLLMAALPWLMSHGAAVVSQTTGSLLKIISGLWAVSAPVFFFLPTSIDGIYERYLGLLACAVVILLARLFIRHGHRAPGGGETHRPDLVSPAKHSAEATR
ncbi:MAG: DUF998 domain-containing protein [Hoeflea sp.]|uniref:DUF998 domain-containing protein n=1 Tax=Hoeflea sp. TaxID=1940281 RepID=UPI0032EC35BD